MRPLGIPDGVDTQSGKASVSLHQISFDCRSFKYRKVTRHIREPGLDHKAFEDTERSVFDKATAKEKDRSVFKHVSKLSRKRPLHVRHPYAVAVVVLAAA